MLCKCTFSSAFPVQVLHETARQHIVVCDKKRRDLEFKILLIPFPCLCNQRPAPSLQKILMAVCFLFKTQCSLIFPRKHLVIPHLTLGHFPLSISLSLPSVILKMIIARFILRFDNCGSRSTDAHWTKWLHVIPAKGHLSKSRKSQLTFSQHMWQTAI